MSLKKLPKDIIIYQILAYLDCNKDCASLMKTCKYLWDIAKKYGYIRDMSLTHRTKPIHYIKCFNKNLNTIKTVFIHKQTDPHNWIFKSPQYIACHDCDLTEPYEPMDSKTCKTEIFIFRNLTTPFETDWSFFPKLRKLVLTAGKIKTKNIETLKNLEYAYVASRGKDTGFVYTWQKRGRKGRSLSELVRVLGENKN